MNEFIKMASGFLKLKKNASTVIDASKAEKSNNTEIIAKTLGGLPLHVVEGVTNIVTNVTDYLKIAEFEQTKREGIRAQRDVALAELQNRRADFSEMLKYTFQERAIVLQKQFDTLDHALNSGDVVLIQASLQAMVNVIQTSPFKDIAEMQKQLSSKDFVLRLE
jgi:hypothetical protein